MMRKIFTILLLVILYSGSLFSQNLELIWQQCLGGSEMDYATDMITFNKNYYIVGGTVSNDGNISFNHGEGDAWLIKTDSLGNFLWEKTYGGSSGDFWMKILASSNNYFYLLGSSGSSDGDISYDPYPESVDFWIVKVDTTGNILWNKIIGGSILDQLVTGTLTNDGGIVAFGFTGSQDGDVSINYGIYDMWMVKLSSDGEIEWDKSFGTDDFDYGQAIIKTSDGGFLIGGASTIGNSGNLTCEPYNYNAEAILVKLDSNGNIEWQQCYGGSAHEGIYGLLENDNGYVFTAFTESPDGDVSGWHGDDDIWFVKTDFSGNIIWETCYGGFKDEVAFNIFNTADDSFVIIGQTQSNDGDVIGNHSISEYYNDIWIIKISIEGEIIWQQCFGGIGSEATPGLNFGVLKKSDYNFVVAAQTDYGPSYDVQCTPHSPYGVPDFWVFEIDSLDTTGTTENLFEKDMVRVYPNPANDYVEFKVSDHKSEVGGEITVFGVLGKEVARLEVKDGRAVWDCHEAINGIYFWQMYLEDKLYTGKIYIHK